MTPETNQRLALRKRLVGGDRRGNGNRRMLNAQGDTRPQLPSELYAELRPVCLTALRRALNPSTALYDRQIRKRRWEATHDTEDLTSTAICMIGIDRAGIPSDILGLDPARTLEALVELAHRRKYRGGLGLVIWANAVWGGMPLADLVRRVGAVVDDLSHFISPLTTMEIAWLLSGLIHDWHRTKDRNTECYVVAAMEQLLDRYHPGSHLMCHAADAAPLVHRMRRSIANFADQVYSVQALSFATIATGSERALQAANNCAGRLVGLQGELGQWWWHYDSSTGRVVQAYPVYSVHQGGMAPMALAALAAAGGTKFTEAAVRGHAWLDHNELGESMIDHQAQTIWRDIEYDEYRCRKLVRHFRSVIGCAGRPRNGGCLKLKLNCETRPYEWAWCIYAGAIETNTKKRAHLV